MPKKIRLKITIIGPPGSGKSCFINNLMQKPFNPSYKKTEGYQLYLFKFSKDRVDYEIQLWECGSEHKQYNKHIKQAFFKNSSAAFLMFDLTDQKWKDKVEEWLSQAYQFDCFLVYAIGTKKDLFLKNRYESVHGSESLSQQRLSQSLLEKEGIETLNQLQINKFFEQFQIKHFYQAAVQPFHKTIKNVFITIQNDQQKLTRSSLAVGRRFDNTIIDIHSENLDKQQKMQMMIESVKLQQQGQSTPNKSNSQNTKKSINEHEYKLQSLQQQGQNSIK